MKTINRKTLFLAIAGISAAGAVGSAQAVSVAPTNLGQALIYPYYTVKGSDAHPFYTMMSVVNTTASTKAVKIRFREGKGSAEVLDFNIFLSPYDVWVGELAPSAAGGVKLTTPDNTCTLPRIPAAGVEFRNGKYVGDGYRDNSLTRLREGYFEIIEMVQYYDYADVAIFSKHDADGVPFDCSAINDTNAQQDIAPPGGGLSGTVSLVQPTKGLNSATTAVALANFTTVPFYSSTAMDTPTMAEADPWSVTVTNSSDRWWSAWPGLQGGVDAVSAALMKKAIINEYVLDSATASATDWVITFPTKWAYVSSTVRRPFQSPWSSVGSCDDIILNYWSREEQQVTPDDSDFSPRPTTPTIQLCWEANVVSFNRKNIFGSSNTLGANVDFEHGWARIDFVNTAHKMVNSATYAAFSGTGVATANFSTVSFRGLPAIGFAVQTFNPGVNAYAGTFQHSYVTNIAPALLTVAGSSAR